MLWEIFGFHIYEEFMDHHGHSRNLVEMCLLQAEPPLAKVWKKGIAYFKTTIRKDLEELVQENCIIIIVFIC